jgi:hypothetical protein
MTGNLGRVLIDIADKSDSSWRHGISATVPGHIFTKMGPIELKLCICTLIDILITIETFFLYKVVRKTRSEKRPQSRRLIDAVSGI